MNTFERIAKKVKTIANEIQKIDNLDLSKSINDSRIDILGIEKEILELINEKIATNLDNRLKGLYALASELNSSAYSVESKIEMIIDNKKNKTEQDVKNCREIRDAIFKTKKLDEFYKSHLNPKFNFHGITHFVLNNKMNELKQTWKNLNKTITIFEKY